MMVGVDALITSWCKILKPASHLAASSLESAGETNRNRKAMPGSGKTAAQTLAPASHTVQTGAGGEPVPTCRFAGGHQDGISFRPAFVVLRAALV